MKLRRLNLSVRDYTKLITIFGVLVVTGILGFYGKLEGEAVASLIAACLGYVFGNSHGAIEARNNVKT